MDYICTNFGTELLTIQALFPLEGRHADCTVTVATDQSTYGSATIGIGNQRTVLNWTANLRGLEITAVQFIHKCFE